jgi:glycosyltransferase involved in cell wall biosynthesis
MKIAFIEFEYPPDTSMGGIGAYTWEASRALTKRGHRVEVFAGAKDRFGSVESEGVLVHRVWSDVRDFYLAAGRAFVARHQEVGFDVLEGAELTAPAREAARLVPTVPLVVRLHGPSFVLRSMELPALATRDRWRHVFGALRRGQRPFWWSQSIDKYEREHVHQADVIAATSQAVADLVKRRWGFNSRRVIVSPLPISPDPALLEIPPGGNNGGVITYLGHLVVGKGLVELVEAMRVVMKGNTQVRLKLVGKAGPGPGGVGDMRQYIQNRLAEFSTRVEIPGPIAREQIPELFRETDIVVLPSHWETFGIVCVEAMAAARAVIGTTSGGMSDLLGHGEVGLLVPPFRSAALSRAILDLLKDPQRREALGIKARQRLLREFNIDRALAIQEQCYLQAIAAKRGNEPHRNGKAATRAGPVDADKGLTCVNRN